MMKMIFRRNPELANFISYTVPATVGMLLAGIYTVVDGLFVGWGAGDDALAAINVAFPFSCLFLALGEMLGNGTGITIAYCRGRGKMLTAGLFFGNLISMMIPLGVPLTLASPLYGNLVGFMGAEERIAGMAGEYAGIIGAGCLFQIITSSLLAVMRHDRAQFQAMYIMLAGLAANIVLDYLLVLVYPFGVKGSAWATVAAQCLTALLAVIYFIRGKFEFAFRVRHLRPYASIFGKILLTGLPSFGLQMMGAMLILLHNIQAQRFGGLLAVAAYAIVSSVTTPVMMLSEGIGLGIQPPVSFHHGCGEERRKLVLLRYALTCSGGIGLLCALALLFGNRLIPEAFHATPSLTGVTAEALMISSLSLIPLGVFQIFCAYFQAEGRSTLASVLIYGDFCVMFPLALFVLPEFFGLAGVWAAVPVSKWIMLMIAGGVWIGLRAKRGGEESLLCHNVSVGRCEWDTDGQ